ncbi:MAG: intradiol ring-cleavage dioxygenase [Thermomicrobiales bacterium]|nr:intradiol ring-cleavage dioxygenase [Thermomicrobiales bacterium]
MTASKGPTLTRRQLQKIALMAPAPLALAAALRLNPADLSAATPEATPTAYLPPTPACGDDDDLDRTESQTEGPYFTLDSPERDSFIEEGMSGERMILTGYVYSTDCKPIDKALLDVWHADDQGVYDLEGYRLRGHLFTDEDGLFRLETIKPGLYPGRTRHFHLKVQAPDGPILTTQLYFPDEPANDGDGIYDPDLEMEIVEPTDDAPLTGIYTFVIETS